MDYDIQAKMKLREALESISQPAPQDSERIRYLLGCSSTLAHLRTFLHAYLRKRLPQSTIEVDCTTYDDLLGSLEHFRPEGYAGAAVVCEWYDLDPRLGFRRLGGWGPGLFGDILAGVRSSFSRLQSVIERISATVPVVVVLPTLPLPPVEISVPAQAGRFEVELCRSVGEFAAWCSERPGVRLLSPAELDRESPPSDRFDLCADLGQGTPYKLAHTSSLAELISRLLAPDPRLKGLITDLDDTLWDGILGEVGVPGVGFTLETGAQNHGLYQQFLQSLAERGVLIAIASKNDAGLAEQALNRADMVIRRASFFPVEVHWKPKSESIARILAAWNIGADAVAFIDDNPLETAEVQAAFPEIQTLIFPKTDPAALMKFFHTLRDWFGQSTLREEDRIRSESLQSTAEIRAGIDDMGSLDAFLAGIDAHLLFQLSRDQTDDRAFELVNKTNQFNLNGHRLSEANWRELLGQPDAFLLTVTYKDKFGPLGKIAVLVGRRLDREAAVSSWVMSCRAFSRRIEHATLRYLFEQLDLDRVSFQFEATERNTPLREFFSEMKVLESAAVLSRVDFDACCPHLSHVLDGIAANV